MDGARFTHSQFGGPAREPGNQWAFTYYLPSPIPRSIPLDTHVATVMSDADAALGNLQGLATIVTDPSVLIGPYQRREALASSRIEGTQASLSDVLQAEADASSGNDNTLEVLRYLQATDRANSLIKSLPISQRLILQLHEILLRGVRGKERNPGEFRSSPVWVGPAGATPESAPFVPPLPQHLAELMSDWEFFVNADGRQMPALIQAALMHYQFETIHPFLDGNGRIGRLLINLLLMERNRLPYPLLYVSSYFETYRHVYYERLQAVRETGDINGWLLFFLRAVESQANDAVARSRQLIAIRDSYMKEAIQTRSKLPSLVGLLMANPVVTVKQVERATGLTNQGARLIVKSAENRGWLTPLATRGRGGRALWIAPQLMEILEAPMAYLPPPQ